MIVSLSKTSDLNNWSDSGENKQNSKHTANPYFGGEKNEKASSELEFEVPCVIHEKSEYMNMDGTQVLDKIGTSELLVDNLK